MERGMSITIRAFPSINRRPRFPTGSSRTRTGRGCIAPGAELKRYAEHVAEKYNVRRFMRFNTIVEGARWDDDAQVWRVALAGGETLSAQFLIAATGFLCQPKTPDIRRYRDVQWTHHPHGRLG